MVTSALHVLVDRRPDLGIEVSVTGGKAEVERSLEIWSSKPVTGAWSMKVWWNGHRKGNWPISTGQPGDDPRTGITCRSPWAIRCAWTRRPMA